jgi:hypothetical protein
MGVRERDMSFSALKQKIILSPAVAQRRNRLARRIGRKKWEEVMHVRQKSLLPILGAIVGIGLLANIAASAQTLPVQGKIVSAGIVFTSPFSSLTKQIYTTPKSGHFILTMFCGSSGGVLFVGSIHNIDEIIAEIPTSACVSFYPGFPLPQNKNLVCETESGPNPFCSIIGVIE